MKTVFNEVHWKKAMLSMDSTDVGMVKFFRALFPKKRLGLGYG